jgi:M6 family metalloprotease-like protein
MTSSSIRRPPFPGPGESCVPQRHPVSALPADHFLVETLNREIPAVLRAPVDGPLRAPVGRLPAPAGRLHGPADGLHTLSLVTDAPVRTFTIVALFFNLDSPTTLSNANNYSATTIADVAPWLAVGTPNRSQFIHNYWAALSYGKLQVGVTAYTESNGTPHLTTVHPAADNADDWGNIAQQIVQADPTRVWTLSGGTTDGSTRVIPSLVLVQNYDTHASATLNWDWEFDHDGTHYRVDDLTHVRITDDIIVECHEHGHNFLNSGDLYGGGGGKIGYWDLLGDSLRSGQMSDVFSVFKQRLGWVSFNDVLNGPTMAARQLVLRPYATTGDCFKVVPDPAHNPSEYFLLEYRTSTGSDPWIPDGGQHPGGLLITHANSRIGEDGSTSTSSSPFLDVEEADGNDGKCWDDRGLCNLPWSDFSGDLASDPGASAFPPNNWPSPDRPAGTLLGAGASFTRDTTPSSRFYGGRDSGLSVTNVSYSDGVCRCTVTLSGNDQNALHLPDGWQGQLADFDGDGLDELLVFTGTSLALVDAVDNQFHVVWRADGQLGGWRFGPRDRFTVGDFNGDGRADVVVRSDSWAGLFLSDGQSLSEVWMTGDPAQHGDWVGGWHLGAQDRTWAGDFDGDGCCDLFVRSPQWASMWRSTGTGFELAWISGDPAANANWIGGWHLGAQDGHVIGDFDGDGRDDVFVHNGGWAGLLLSTGAGFNEAWMTGDPAHNQNWVGGWHVGAGDVFVAGDFDGDGATDLWVHNQGWAGLWHSTGTGFTQAWISGDPGAHANWIDGWHLGDGDRYVAADFSGHGRCDLFVRSDQWAALLVSDGDHFHVEAMTGDPAKNWNWIGPLHLTSHTDREKAAQLHYLPRHGIFQQRSDGTTGAFVPLGDEGKLGFDASWVGPAEFASRLPSARAPKYLTGHFADRVADSVLVADGTGLGLWADVDSAPHLLGRSGPWVGGWHLGPFDRFTVADLDGDGLDEVFVRSPGWAGVLAWRQGAFRCEWISGDPAANQNWVGGWHLGPQDRAVAADLDGDGRQELFVTSPQWAGVFRWNGSALSCPWMTGDPAANANWIGGWHVGPQDRTVAGHFRGNRGAELFIRSPLWAGMLGWNGSALDTVWMSGDPAANRNWVDGWHLGPQDRSTVGRFHAGADDVLIRSRRWAGVLRWNGSALSCPWMTGDPAANLDWIGGWHLDPRDRVTVADTDGDGVDEVFIRSAGWAGLLGASGAGLTSRIVTPTAIATWNLNAFDGGGRLRRSGGHAGVLLTHPWGWTGVTAASATEFDMVSAQFRTLTS